MSLPPPSRPEGHRPLSRLALAAALGLAFGVGLLVFAPRDRPSTPLVLRCYGRELPADHDPLEIVVEAARKRFEGWFNLSLPDGERRALPYAALGVELDQERLREIVRDLQHGAGVSSQMDAQLGLELPIPVRTDTERAWTALLELKDTVDRAPTAARIDVIREAVLPEQPGRLLDVDRTLAAVERAIERGEEEARLAFETLPPARSAAELASVRFDVTLAAFETPAAGASVGGPAGRRADLELAASRIDGHVLMPGELFAFNAQVGPRDAANGFASAAAASGEPLDASGGAICQISGTLHAAAAFAGLEVVERHPETAPSAWLELGLDAAVAYPAIDLRLRNPYDFPVVLHETLDAGRVRAEVRGARRPYTISIVRKIDVVSAFPEIERPDDALALGERAVVQRGAPGIELHRYRIRRQGPHAVREVIVDRHPPVPRVIGVGTGRATTANGRPPRDREWRFDELLVMTQSDNPDGALREQRVPGRFGGGAWTKNIGAPVRDPPAGGGVIPVQSGTTGRLFW